MFPAAEGTPIHDELAKLADPEAGNRAHAIHWITFGQLLRHELGGDTTCPENPRRTEGSHSCTDHGR